MKGMFKLFLDSHFPEQKDWFFMVRKLKCFIFYLIVMGILFFLGVLFKLEIPAFHLTLNFKD